MTNWEVSIKKLTQTKQNIYSLKINLKKLQTFDSIHFKGFNWSPSNCECECDKSCDVGKYLDYKNCRKRLVDILVNVVKILMRRNYIQMKWFIVPL